MKPIQLLLTPVALLLVLMGTLSSNGQAPATPSDQGRKVRARLHFAPMWLPPQFFQALADPNAAAPKPSATAYLGLIQAAARLKVIELSPAQQTSLAEIDAAALATAAERTEQFKNLSPVEQAVEVESWGGKSAPWRDQLEKESGEKVNAVVTPEQIAAVKQFAFPMHAVSSLYDPETRQAIDFNAEQQDNLRQVIRERLSKFQAEFLKRADRMWALLTPEQQAALPSVVASQGPTSATLSVAYHMGFDFETPSVGYPLLSEEPVRKRLKLTAEQEAEYQTILADAKAALPPMDDSPPSPEAIQRAEEADKIRSEQHTLAKKRIETLLTLDQLKMLEEVDFLRAVVLALGYPEKRASAGITDADLAKFLQIDAEALTTLHQIDREMLDKAMQLLTPAQKEKLAAEGAKRMGW